MARFSPGQVRIPVQIGPAGWPVETYFANILTHA
jgi:hypothetical protein